MEKTQRQRTVVLAIVERDGRVLITHRVDPGRPMWDKKWELPGGKIEDNETPEQAIVRELWEETGLEVSAPELLGVQTHFWDRQEYVQQTFLLCYRCQAKTDQVRLDPRESDAYRWVTPQEFLEVESMLDGGIELFKRLYLQQPATDCTGIEHVMVGR